ncbi:NHL repeat-containing protein [Deferrisoma palaeochoriense]
MAVLAASVGLARELSWRFDEAYGERGRGRNELRDPVDVAVTAGGEIVALDRDREALVWFSRAGRWERTLGGSRGAGEVRLDRPRRLGLGPDGRLWVVDTGNHRLVVVDKEGAEAFVLGSLGSADGRFRHPADVTFDERGRLYVADAGNERIQVFRPDGGFLASWDRRTGGRRDHLETPVAVAYTPEGRGGIWVLNEGWRRLERFDLEGSWEETLDLSGWLPEGAKLVAVEVDPVFYRMFLSDAGSGRVWVLNRRGERVAEIGDGVAPFRPAGFVVERDWDLYLADRAGARILRFTRE